MSVSRKIPQLKRSKKISPADIIKKVHSQAQSISKSGVSVEQNAPLKLKKFDEPKRKVTYVLPAGHVRQLKMLGAVQDKQQSQLVTEALEMLFKSYNK